MVSGVYGFFFCSGMQERFPFLLQRWCSVMMMWCSDIATSISDGP